MNKHIISIQFPVFLLLMLFILSSCQSNDEPDPLPVLSVNPLVTEVVFSQDGKILLDQEKIISNTFEVNTNQSVWDVVFTQESDWCKVDKNAINDSFTITATPNDQKEKRLPAILRVTADSSAPIEMKISQYEADLSISPFVSEVEFSADGTSVTSNGENVSATFQVFTIRSDWKAEIIPADSWCSVTKDGNKLILSANANTTYFYRENVILQITAEDTEAITIHLSQKAKSKDVYLVGTCNMGKQPTAIYWKNDKMITLPHDGDFSNASSIMIYNGSVYVSGTISYSDIYGENGYSKLGYWKDGVFSEVNHLGFSGQVYKIRENKGNIYMVGYVLNEKGEHIAALWKNGELTVLPSEEKTSARSIFFDGDDIYLAGLDASKACYWKNGEQFFLRTEGSSWAEGLFIFNNDLYVYGTLSSRKSGYWKNGIPIPLGNYNIFAGTIHNNSLYMAGADYSSGQIAALWINDEPQSGFESYSNITCVFSSDDDFYMGGNYNGSNSYINNAFYIHNGKTYLLPISTHPNVSDMFVYSK